jgi:hypothetical protein
MDRVVLQKLLIAAVAVACFVATKWTPDAIDPTLIGLGMLLVGWVGLARPGDQVKP